MDGSKTFSDFECKQNSYAKLLMENAHILADPSHSERFTDKFDVEYPTFITKELFEKGEENV